VELCAALIDKLRQRLGPCSVRRFEPVASHLPEHAEVLTPEVTISTAARPRESGDPISRHSKLDSRLRGNERETAWPKSEQTRPLLLLPRAEPAKVTALVPDGPPRRFFWRGVTHEIKGAQGPERIGAEWWRHPLAPAEEGSESVPTRDYYLVEDHDGHRFWLYREGLYGRETSAARWFVHGLFA